MERSSCASCYLHVCGSLAWTHTTPNADVPDLPRPFWRGAKEEAASFRGERVPMAWECCCVPEGANPSGARPACLPAACGKGGWSVSGMRLHFVENKSCVDFLFVCFLNANCLLVSNQLLSIVLWWLAEEGSSRLLTPSSKHPSWELVLWIRCCSFQIAR